MKIIRDVLLFVFLMLQFKSIILSENARRAGVNKAMRRVYNSTDRQDNCAVFGHLTYIERNLNSIILP